MRGSVARAMLGAAAGLLTGLTMPTASLVVLLPVALVPLMLALRGASVRGGAAAGGAFGFVFWIVTIPWIGYTVHHFGGFAWPLAAVAVAISAVLLAIPFAGMAGLVAAASPRGAVSAALVWAAAWVVQEAARTYVFGGFPWALLAAPLVSIPPLAQSAALGGVLLPGALVVVTNGLVCAAVSERGAGRRAGFVVGAFLLPLAAWGLGAARIRALGESPGPVLPPLRVSLLQPNVEQAIRFTAAESERTYQELLEQTRSVARAEHPDLILWPESAAPWLWQSSQRFQADLLALCLEERTAVLFNTVWVERAADDDAPYYNAALLVTADGPVLPPYEKQRLVPFGEYVPLGTILRAIQPISRAVPGSFSAGTGGRPIPLGAWRLGGAVCYEVVYPWIARGHVERGANVLFTLTNDAWYGTLGAREQHWQGAAYRSIETGVPLLRAAITGWTGWVDPAGRAERIPLDRKGAMTLTLGGSSGFARPIAPPPAQRTGGLLAWVCTAGLFICILRARVFQPQKTAGIVRDPERETER